MPTCTICQRDLPESHFYVRHDKGYRRADCKDCVKGRTKQNYEGFGRYDRYGITREQYEAQWERQGRRCALCGSDHSGRRNFAWNIDHAHGPDHPPKGTKWRVATGEAFRGILCNTCNTGVGHFEKFAALVGRERFFAYVEGRVDGDLSP